MTTIITHSGGVITPEVVDGFDAEREARSIVHTIMGREDPDVTMRPSSLQQGTLTLVFATGAAAAAAAATLNLLRVFTLSDSDVPEVNMSFVVANGRARRRLDSSTRKVWIVEVPFSEVAP